VDWIWVASVVGVLYYVGIRRAGMTGPTWPLSRAAAFYAGLALYLGVILSPLDPYDNVSFFLHTAEHLIFVFMVAPLVALGAPITLLLRASPSRFRERRLLPLLDSRAASILIHPAATWLAFIGFFLATPLIAPLYNHSLSNGLLHLWEHNLYLITAFLFWWPIVGVDPVPRRVSFPARLVYLAAALPFVAFLGLTVLLEGDPLYPHYVSLPPPWGGRAAVISQHDGGILLLVAGSVAVVCAMTLVMAAWMRDQDAQRPRVEGRIARGPVPKDLLDT